MPIKIDEMRKIFANARKAGWSIPIDETTFSKSDLAEIGDDFYPRRDSVFRAFEIIPPEKVRVVILGQDPYYARSVVAPNDPIATGIAFEIMHEEDVRPSDSLTRILNKAYPAGWRGMNRTNLRHWAQTKGLLLLNSALTIRGSGDRSCARSHLKCWSKFVVTALDYLAQTNSEAQFIALGRPAVNLIAATTVPPRRVHQFSHPVARRSNLPPFRDLWVKFGDQLIVK